MGDGWQRLAIQSTVNSMGASHQIAWVKRQDRDRLEKGEYDSYGMPPLPAAAGSS